MNIQIKFKPTGNIFTLPEEEVNEIMRNDRGNYEVLTEGFAKEPEAVKETTTYNKVVVEEEAPKPKTKAKAKKKVEE